VHVEGRSEDKRVVLLISEAIGGESQHVEFFSLGMLQGGEKFVVLINDTKTRSQSTLQGLMTRENANARVAVNHAGARQTRKSASIGQINGKVEYVLTMTKKNW